MFRDDAVADRQAPAPPGSQIARCRDLATEIGLPDFLAQLGGNPTARVRHGHHDFLQLHEAAHTEFAAIRHGFQRVFHQIAEEYLYLTGNPHNLRCRIVQLDKPLVRAFRQEFQRSLQYRIDINFLKAFHISRFFIRDEQRLIHDLHGPVNLLFDDAPVFFNRFRSSHAFGCHADNIQRRANLVMRLPRCMGDGPALVTTHQLYLRLMLSSLILEIELFQFFERRQSIQNRRDIAHKT